jgi:hypothetical protein
MTIRGKYQVRERIAFRQLDACFLQAFLEAAKNARIAAVYTTYDNDR